VSVEDKSDPLNTNALPNLYAKSVSVSFGVNTAMLFLGKKLINLQPDDTILINGASGAVGVMSVQLAKKYFKAKHVTAVCSEANAKLCLALGADRVVDYRSEEWARMLRDDDSGIPTNTNSNDFDAILDCVGALNFHQCRKTLLKNSSNPRFAQCAIEHCGDVGILCCPCFCGSGGGKGKPK
jgi:NADPH:quinone reductase-like Zn-dependent oxidoreductase